MNRQEERGTAEGGPHKRRELEMAKKNIAVVAADGRVARKVITEP